MDRRSTTPASRPGPRRGRSNGSVRLLTATLLAACLLTAGPGRATAAPATAAPATATATAAAGPDVPWYAAAGASLTAADAGSPTTHGFIRWRSGAETDLGAGVSGVRWSPDGAELAVDRADGFAVVRPDGTVLATAPGLHLGAGLAYAPGTDPGWSQQRDPWGTLDPAPWSPDGRFLVAQVAGTWEQVVVDLNGPAVRWSLGDVAVPGGAHWSDDGAYLAWVDGYGHVTVARADGSDRRIVLVVPITTSWSWRPGTHELTELRRNDGDGTPEVVRLDLDSGAREVVRTTVAIPPASIAYAWSPDGASVALAGGPTVAVVRTDATPATVMVADAPRTFTSLHWSGPSTLAVWGHEPRPFEFIEDERTAFTGLLVDVAPVGSPTTVGSGLHLHWVDSHLWGWVDGNWYDAHLALEPAPTGDAWSVLTWSGETDHTTVFNYTTGSWTSSSSATHTWGLHLRTLDGVELDPRTFSDLAWWPSGTAVPSAAVAPATVGVATGAIVAAGGPPSRPPGDTTLATDPPDPPAPPPRPVGAPGGGAATAARAAVPSSPAAAVTATVTFTG